MYNGISSKTRHNWKCFCCLFKVHNSQPFFKKTIKLLFTFVLCNFFMQRLQKPLINFNIFDYAYMKKLNSKVALNQPIFFQCCQLAQKKPKSPFLFHKNCIPSDLCSMTLLVSSTKLPIKSYLTHCSKMN